MATNKVSNSETIAGFTNDFSGRDGIGLVVYGAEGSGKTHFLATATEWAVERGTLPAWLVWDRKTRLTVRRMHEENNWPMPYINKDDFITAKNALEIARYDREDDKDNTRIKATYSEAFKRVLDIVGPLVESKKADPIIIETGTALYDMISFAHFGKKQGVGRDRVWGPPKQDWTDLMDLLSSKSVLISCWEKEEFKNDARTGKTKPDGPNHLGYSTTSWVKLTHNRIKTLDSKGNPAPMFSLDIVVSQDNTALEGEPGQNILTDDDITFKNLIDLLRPEY